MQDIYEYRLYEYGFQQSPSIGVSVTQYGER